MKREELKDTIYSILFRQIDVVSENELCEATDEVDPKRYTLNELFNYWGKNEQ